MPSRSGSSNAEAWVLAPIVGASVGYAVLRYNILGGVAWSEAPLYVSNKGLSLGAVALFALSYLSNHPRFGVGAGGLDPRQVARVAGLTGFGLGVIHILISFAVLTAAHYPSLFNAAHLNAVGIFCLVCGALAAALFAVPAAYSFPRLLPSLGAENWKRGQQLGYVGLGLTALHVFLVGGQNWLAASRWPGGMPPISLLSFLTCGAPIAAKLISNQAVRRAPIAAVVTSRSPTSQEAASLPGRRSLSPAMDREGLDRVSRGLSP